MTNADIKYLSKKLEGDTKAQDIINEMLEGRNAINYIRKKAKQYQERAKLSKKQCSTYESGTIKYFQCWLEYKSQEMVADELNEILNIIDNDELSD